MTGEEISSAAMYMMRCARRTVMVLTLQLLQLRASSVCISCRGNSQMPDRALLLVVPEA